MRNLNQLSADELLQLLQMDINNLINSQRVSEENAKAHMDIAEKLHERAVRYEGIINLLKSRA